LTNVATSVDSRPSHNATTQRLTTHVAIGEENVLLASVFKKRNMSAKAFASFPTTPHQANTPQLLFTHIDRAGAKALA